MNASTTETLKALGPKIAENLTGWQYIANGSGFDESHFLIPANENAKAFAPFRSNCLSIHLQLDHKGRIRVTGFWPRGRKDGNGDSARGIPGDIREDSPEITCAATRPAKQIAAEIERRFLPEYKRIHALLVEYLAKQDAAHDRQREVVAEFGKIMGDKPRNNRASWCGDACYGHIDVNHGGETATLELRGNVEILKAALIAAGKAGAFKRD